MSEPVATPSTSPEKTSINVTPPLRARRFPQPLMSFEPQTPSIHSLNASPQTRADKGSMMMSGTLAGSSLEYFTGNPATSPYTMLSTPALREGMLKSSPQRSSSTTFGMDPAVSSGSGGGLNHSGKENGGNGGGGAHRNNSPVTPTLAPQLQQQRGGLEHAAVDVQGFYSQHQVNGVPIIPQELPSSHFLYILTTSEGRDKLFKCLQYALKIGIWIFYTGSVLPEGTAPFARGIAQRLAGNVQTIRHGRSMFKLGRWIITLFHLQTIVERLMQKHTPEAYERVRRLQEAMSDAIAVVISHLGKAVGGLLPGRQQRRVIVPTPPTSLTASMEVDDSGRPGVPGCYDERGQLRSPTHSHRRRVSRDGAASGRGSHQDSAISPNRVRSVTFPTVASMTSSHMEDDSQPHHVVILDAAEGPIPGSYAHAARWRRSPNDFSTPLMLFLGLRCLISVGRNAIRDGLFLEARSLMASTFIHTHRPMLQKAASTSWLMVSLLDLGLNTWRLCDAGWFKYSSIRRASRVYCYCSMPISQPCTPPPMDAPCSVFGHVPPPLPTSTTILRDANGSGNSNNKVAFAPLDFDYGSVTPTTVNFAEAAMPSQLRPICTVCGFILSHPNSEAATPCSSSEDDHAAMRYGERPLLIPLLVRKWFDFVWMCRNHANLSHTLLLQARYVSDVILSWGYSMGDFEPAEGEEPLVQHLHLPASIAGLVSAVIALNRVRALPC